MIPTKLKGRRNRGILSNILFAAQVLFVERRVPVLVWRQYYKLLSKCGRKTAVIRNKAGLTVEGFTNSLGVYFETWSKHDYDIDGFKFAPGQTVLDIGANLGFFTLYAACKGARVLAFEPSKQNFELLQKNVTNNKLGSLVTCVNRALSLCCGEAVLYEGLDKSGRFLSDTVSITDDNRGGEKVITTKIETISLNEVFQKYDITTCDFIKMDCEGAEYDILAGADPATLQRVRYISLEYHNGSDEIRTYLERGGFEILSTSDGFDAGFGIIRARSKLVRSPEVAADARKTQEKILSQKAVEEAPGFVAV